MNTKAITWTGSPDDQTAKVGEYVLKYYQVETRLWWWCLFVNGNEQRWGSRSNSTAAKTAAINAMKEHLKTQ